MNREPAFRTLTFDGTTWTVHRRSAGWAGVVPEGQLPPLPKLAGLVFTSETGARRFLRRNHPELPSEDELQMLTEARLQDFFARAV